MKKTIAILALFFVTLTASAQFYVSLSGGATLKANEQVIGSTSYFGTDFSTENKGSYGEGINGQLRVGYFFNDTFGLELGAGYLNGADQANNQIIISEAATASTTVSSYDGLDMYARARAFGASLSAIVNVTKNVYVRVGALTKIGGRTENFATFTDFTLPDIDLTTGSIVGVNVHDAEIQTDFQGELPFGFIGGIGYRYNLNDNLSLFAELEYMNIKVRRKSSSLAEFSGTINDVSVTAAEFAQSLATTGTLVGNEQLVLLSLLLDEDVDWSEANIDAPYSSVGANIGITYKF